ncbi:hypothetical protein OXIME_001407 [Oxyplasma meridianum]|uniref:Uncharacterized protein n=1 Tax=Oxyplasma meridianum TaxID=3073602 RepID=A0AAX4NH56_9ARCH
MNAYMIYSTVQIPTYSLLHMIKDAVFFTADMTLPSAVFLMVKMGIYSKVIWSEGDL